MSSKATTIAYPETVEIVPRPADKPVRTNWKNIYARLKSVQLNQALRITDPTRTPILLAMAARGSLNRLLQASDRLVIQRDGEGILLWIVSREVAP